MAEISPDILQISEKNHENTTESILYGYSTKHDYSSTENRSEENEVEGLL